MDLTDTVVVTWGDDDAGQLGGGLRTLSTEPMPVRQLDAVSPRTVHCGPATTACVTDDGRVFMWGARVEGDEDRYGSGEVHQLRSLSGIKDLSIGGSHRAAVYSRPPISPVLTWGDGGHGRLGNGSWDPCDGPEDCLVLSRRLVTQVSCGGAHTAALTGDGDVFTFGAGGCGQLGHGGVQDQVVPRAVERVGPDAGLTVAKVACGNDFTACLTDAGGVLTFGFGAAGQLGHGNKEDVDRPRTIAYFESKREIITDIACGYYHMLAVGTSGRVYAWGSGTGGKLGHGDSSSSDTPREIEYAIAAGGTQVRLADLGVTHVACGWHHSLLLTRGGKVLTFGAGRRGRLGHGGEGDVSVPRVVEALEGMRVTHIDGGAAHSAAVAIR